MDPISKALERARQEQQSLRGWMQPAPVSREESSSRVHLRSARRKVTLDPAVLHRHFLLCGASSEDPTVTDKYRLLRTRVQQIMTARGWRSLGVTSPGIKAGKTVTAINLAISMAREGNYRVLLVDADIRKPSVERYLGFDSPNGMPDFLRGAAQLDDTIVDIEDPANLSVLPGLDEGMKGPQPELLKSPRMHELLQDIPAADRSSIVIVDLPPALVGDDVIAVAAHLDALLVVVDESSTTIDDLKQTIELLKDFNVIGTVLNKSSEKPKAHEGYYAVAGTAADGMANAADASRNG